eukprot:357499-Chlamydomonas_euryale.AAC.6
MRRAELHGTHGGDWGYMPMQQLQFCNRCLKESQKSSRLRSVLPGVQSQLGEECRCQSLPPWQLPLLPPPARAASPDQAALPPPAPLPAGPPPPPATSKGCCPGRPSFHMCTSASCPKRQTRERSYAIAQTCCGGARSIVCILKL